MYINVWKSIAVLPSPSVQITDLWTPFTGFILIVHIFPTKRETKSDGMYEKKKKKKVGHTSTALLPDMV